MCDSDKEEERHEMETSDIKPTEAVPSEKESVDSSSDSGSGSSSGSESESSVTGSQSSSNSKKSSVAEGSDSEKEGSGSGSSNSIQSYKSVNTTLTTKVGKVAKESGTPGKVLTSSHVISEQLQTPAKTEKPTPLKVDKQAVVGSKAEVKSPVPVTPAKSLDFEEEVVVDYADIDTVPQGTSTAVTSKKIGTPMSKAVAQLSPGEIVDQPPVNPIASSKVEVQTEAEAKRKRSSHSTKTTRNEPRSPKTKRRKKDKANKKSTSVEKVKEQVRKLQCQLDLVCKSQTRPSKPDTKPEPTKHKKSKGKKAKTQSSGEASTQSSSSEEPTTSTRIGKIPEGRKRQRLAMSRVKQLGLVKQGEINVVEVTEALKIIKSVQFKPLATDAYRRFHKVPGTDLPHIKKLIMDCLERYGAFVKVVAELNLELARDHDAAKMLLVQPDAGNKFASIWQFCNDLEREAPALDQPSATQPVAMQPPVPPVPPLPPAAVEASVPSVASAAKAPSSTCGSTTTEKRKKQAKKESAGHASGGSSRKSDKKKKKKATKADSEVLIYDFSFDWVTPVSTINRVVL